MNPTFYKLMRCGGDMTLVASWLCYMESAIIHTCSWFRYNPLCDWFRRNSCHLSTNQKSLPLAFSSAWRWFCPSSFSINLLAFYHECCSLWLRYSLSILLLIVSRVSSLTEVTVCERYVIIQ